jgi:hypothetical protein
LYTNLRGLRDLILAQADYSPSKDTVFKGRVDDMINRALWQLAEDAPGIFVEETVEVRAEGDITPASATDYFRAEDSGDRWVLRKTRVVGSALSRALETGVRLAGKKIYLYDDASCAEWQERTIREVWQDTAPDQNTYIYISIVEPWLNATDTEIEWRIFTPFLMPADVIDVRSVYLNRSSTGLDTPLVWIGENEAERRGLRTRSGLTASGSPAIAFAGEWHRLRAPTFEPQVSVLAQPNPSQDWDGPEPEGQFEYMFTYVFGKQEEFLFKPGPSSQDALAPVGQRFNAYKESGPSPVSDPIDPGDAGASPGSAVTVTLPNVAHMLGFDDNTTKRYRKTGIKKRIYRRRISDDGGTLETPDTFFPIAEVDDYVTSWTDDGTLTPDYMAPFRHINGYREIHIDPRPEDENLSLFLRAARRPRELTDDYDSLPVAPDAINVVLYLALSYLYEAAGNPSQSALTAGKYQDHLTKALRRHSDIRPGVIRRTSSRAKARRVIWGPRRTDEQDY